MRDVSESSAQDPVVRVSTDGIPHQERFSWWTEMVDREVMPVTTRCEHAPRFRGWARTVTVPRTPVTTFTFSPMRARRSGRQVSRQDPEDFYLMLARENPIRLEQHQNVACLDAGDMVLFSSSYPLSCKFHDLGRQSKLTMMRLPRAALPLPGGRADRLLAEPLRPARSGPVALLGPYLAGLEDAARASSPQELARLGAIGLDLVATALAGRLGAEDSLPPETRRAALLFRINAFIDQHLGDPELRPAAIAAHHHISVRTLHQLFRDEPETVAATVRRRRLEHCHADLTDPRLARCAIGEIAVRWGFRHAGDLSRAFRDAYGAAPSEVRARARDAKNVCAPC
ncbi:helix-turn-helix domain-containing protein [Streptomyces sp. NPDC059009]|uniref:helix-turn-helix domain-containing protein n=1 Tax=Streptomyces sp. NPDC059009 TaxID=3346694 RepID=UPI0036B7B35F